MTQVPYDAEVLPGLERFRAMSGPTLVAAAVPFVRARIEQVVRERDLLALARDRRLRIDDVTIPGDSTGPASTATIIRPVRSEPDSPAVVHVHGGGMMMGHRLDDLDELVALVERFRVPVITVDYRLAPEHPFPAAADDLLRCWSRLQAEAADLGIDPARIVLSGVSAGGGLAAGLALRLRDLGRTPPAALLLTAPMLDERNDTASSRAYDGTSAWDHGSNELGWTALLGSERRDVSPYASASRAASLGGLPPVYLDVGSAEVFRDEVVSFAQRLWEAGGAAELHVWAGVFHGAERWAQEARVSIAAAAARRTWLERRLATPGQA